MDRGLLDAVLMPSFILNPVVYTLSLIDLSTPMELLGRVLHVGFPSFIIAHILKLAANDSILLISSPGRASSAVYLVIVQVI